MTDWCAPGTDWVYLNIKQLAWHCSVQYCSVLDAKECFFFFFFYNDKFVIMS